MGMRVCRPSDGSIRLKHSLIEAHFLVRRVEVDGMRLHLHVVLDFPDGQISVFFENLADNTPVLGA